MTTFDRRLGRLEHRAWPGAAGCPDHATALQMVMENDPSPSIPPCGACGAAADAVVVRLCVVTVRPEPGDTGLVGVVEQEARNGHGRESDR